MGIGEGPKADYNAFMCAVLAVQRAFRVLRDSIQGLCIGLTILAVTSNVPFANHSAHAAPTKAASKAQPLASAPTEVAGNDETTVFFVPFEKYVLANGLTVILHHDPHHTKVAVNVWYHTGPVNEPRERSGFAHLFEHLMFEGSKYAGRQFDALLEAAGGTNMNGTTNWDRTNYFETVPSEHLELALWLESDRMGFMIDGVTQERLDVQREVVKNERRESFENQPDGPSYLALMDALYPPGHPYHGAVIGSMDDLSRASLDDVRAFFRDFYAPANATLTLAGNFEPQRAKAWIERYFGSLPPRAVAKVAPRPEVPASYGVRLTVKEDVALPRVTWAWRTPPAYSEADAPLQLAARVLAFGKASRLERTLVRSGLANEVSATVDANRLASAFVIQVRLASGATPAQVEQILERELTQLAMLGPSDDELLRARATLAVATASELQMLNSGAGEGGRAGTLQRLNYYLGDPGALPHVMHTYDETSKAAVQFAVKEYLSSARRIVVQTVPALKK